MKTLKRLMVAAIMAIGLLVPVTAMAAGIRLDLDNGSFNINLDEGHDGRHHEGPDYDRHDYERRNYIHGETIDLYPYRDMTEVPHVNYLRQVVLQAISDGNFLKILYIPDQTLILRPIEYRVSRSGEEYVVAIPQDKNGDSGKETRFDFSKIQQVKIVSVWEP